jgi:hypothetical protein
MQRAFPILALVLLVAQLVPAQSSSSTVSRLKLGYVENSNFGCGCSLSYNMSDFRSDKHLLINPMDEATYINLDGKNVVTSYSILTFMFPAKAGHLSPVEQPTVFRNAVDRFLRGNFPKEAEVVRKSAVK